MQYWKPTAEDEFAGDMMPYWDGDRFHLFYLLDRGHHTEQEGMGGHQWAHASTTDLIHWEHYPLAIPRGEPGSVDQHGICTGCIFEQDGVYHAFYPTRLKDSDGAVTEMLCRAASRDLIHFDKSPANPLFGASAGMDPRGFRDPFLFRHPDTGVYHMLVTTARKPAPGVEGEGGVMAHYLSDDLDQWRLQEPFLSLDSHQMPECIEHFFWNGWWYLIYSQWGELQYHVSENPMGPWRRVQGGIIECTTLRVPRTAEFKGGRRLAAGFLAWRENDCDAGSEIYAGNSIFRELFQDSAGALYTRFVPEMMPPTGPAVSLPGVVSQDAGAGTRTVHVLDTPIDCVLTCRLVPQPGAGEFGLLLRADGNLETGYRLRFHPHDRRITLRGWPEDGALRAEITGMEGLERGVEIVVCLKNSIIDVCVNSRRTLVERCFDHRGTHLGFFVTDGAARLEGLHVAPII